MCSALVFHLPEATYLLSYKDFNSPCLLMAAFLFSRAVFCLFVSICYLRKQGQKCMLRCHLDLDFQYGNLSFLDQILNYLINLPKKILLLHFKEFSGEIG